MLQCARDLSSPIFFNPQEKNDMNTKSQSVELVWLKPHPYQEEFFSPAPEIELEELAADLDSRGQQEPIHCTADGTIIRGHRRVECATRLGWETIRTVVHLDVTDATDPGIVNDLILDNYMRRQLDDLALARCYRQLKRTYFSSDDEEGDVRDRLAARLNCGKSGRSLDRLERLLDLPRGIQNAIARGDLTKSHGEKILRLSADSQVAIEQRLCAGDVPRTILQDFGLTRTTATRTPCDIGSDLLTYFKTHLEHLKEHYDQLDQLQVRGRDVNDLLDEAVDFLTDWRDRKRKLRRQSIDAVRLSK